MPVNFKKLMEDRRARDYNVASMMADRDIAGDPIARPSMYDRIREKGLDVCSQCGGKGVVPSGDHPDASQASSETCPSCRGEGGVPMKGAQETVLDGERSKVKDYIYLGELNNCLKKMKPEVVAEAIVRELPTREALEIAALIRRMLG